MDSESCSLVYGSLHLKLYKGMGTLPSALALSNEADVKRSPNRFADLCGKSLFVAAHTDAAVKEPVVGSVRTSP